MNNNTFGVDTAFPPQPPQGPPSYSAAPPPSGYPPPPPGYPPLPPPGQPIPRNRRPRRWPLTVAAGVVGAVVASVAALGFTLHSRSADSTPTQAGAPVTITVPSPTAASPSPLPEAQADRQTCQQGWIPAGNLTGDAQGALHTLPPGVKVGDPQIQSNPAWKSAIDQAATSYHRAADSLEGAIAPGTTPVLAEAAQAAVNALRLLADSYAVNAPILGNSVDIANDAGGHVGLLCQRLAP
jgi:hypothetical protein